jgi:hypothetical protein
MKTLRKHTRERETFFHRSCALIVILTILAVQIINILTQ